MLYKFTGARFKHIPPAYILNEDCTTQYYFTGSQNNDLHNNGWAKVKTGSLKYRDRSSIWSDDLTKDAVYKGIHIKYACGGSAAGLIYLIYIVISNLSKAELLNEYFVVVPIN